MAVRKTVKKTPKKTGVKKKAAAKKSASKKQASSKKKTGARRVATSKKAAAESKSAAKAEASKPAPVPKAKKEPKGKVSSMSVNLGHVFALRPRVNTSFRQPDFLAARHLLQDEAYTSIQEAARAVADKALEMTHEGPSRRGFGPAR
jgi:hypothetical protein